jgi:hypothetical protein
VFNAAAIYLIVIVVIAVVCAQAVFFLISAYKEGQKIGMSRAVLNKVITSSAVFSILPSVGILVTMFGLIEFLGIPFSWLRLNVIGSLMYELTAANAAAAEATGSALGADSNITGSVFVTIALVMSIGIILGGLLCAFGLKRYSLILKGGNKKDKPSAADAENGEATEYQSGAGIPQNADLENTQSPSGTENAAPNVKKKKKLNLPELGNVVSTSIFIALCAAYMGGAIGQAFGGFHIDEYTSVVPFIAMLAAIGSMALITKAAKKREWLQSFSLSISMLVGMLSAIPVSLILGAIFA